MCLETLIRLSKMCKSCWRLTISILLQRVVHNEKIIGITSACDVHDKNELRNPQKNVPSLLNW
jgi:hypothetical protein